jgi:hypothetical protein
MNRLAIIFVVGLLIVPSVRGQAPYVEAEIVLPEGKETIEIQINGNPADGQTFYVGDTITISCYIHAYAKVYGYSVNRAIAWGSLKIGGDYVWPSPYNPDITTYGNVEASAVVQETISETITLDATWIGSWGVAASASAWAIADGSSVEEVHRNDSMIFTVESTPPVLEVGIDIKPGSTPNTINLGSKGVVPVAILSSDTFDATQVDPATVALSGAGVAVRGNGTNYLTIEKDVNGDGITDLEVKVETENLLPGEIQDGLAILTATTYGGQEIEGSDEITIVPPE